MPSAKTLISGVLITVIGIAVAGFALDALRGNSVARKITDGFGG